jgi:dTDP-4-amino-4,6-dideoxygalactose transaminase
MTGRKHALLAGRGAAGIWAALRALDLHDEYVLIPANTCYIVLWAVLRSGNKPLLVDGEPSALSFQQSAKEKIEDKPPGQEGRQADIQKPAAIIPCHVYGLGAPIKGFCEWAKANGVYVIEDAALALGAMVDGKPAGAWGDVSIFSFGLGKIADNQLGGAVLTDDDRLAADIDKLLAELPLWDDSRMALTNQWNAIYWALHQYEADNPRLTELYPALYSIFGELTGYQLPDSYWDDLPGLLRDLPANLTHRAMMAAVYDETLHDLPLRTLPRSEGSILWRYPLLVDAERRDELLQYLWENGVQDATRWYPSLRYMTAALAPEIQQPPTPNADALGASIINLRLDPGVDRSYAQRTVKLIQTYFDENWSR